MVEEINYNTKIVEGRNGKSYKETLLGNFAVPANYVGKYLQINSKTGDVVAKVGVGLSDEEKVKRKAARVEKNTRVRAERRKVKVQAMADKKVAQAKLKTAKDVVKGSISSLSKELRKKENLGDLALADRYKKAMASLAELNLKTYKDFL